ncbi:MAG: glycosyltransferase [Candidatus Omnitrophica bacterium]|nr:glycosyltransferase [Candidatus Omnitrophota bacterium]
MGLVPETKQKNMDTATGEYPLVSVVIPVLDAAEDLERCLDALERQTYPDDRYEVVVVDNGSRVPPRKLVSRYRNIRMLSERKRSTHAARNKGIAEARGTVLAFTDADCISVPDWIREGVRVMTGQKADFVGGHVQVVPEDPDRPNCVEILEMRTAFDQRKYIRQMRFAATANVFVRKEVIDHVGLLNGDLKSGADLEFGNRVSAAGYDMRFAPKAEVKHPARRSLRKLLAKHRRVIGGLIDIKKRNGADIRQMLSDIKGDWPLWRDLRESWESGGKYPLTVRIQVVFTLVMVKAVRVLEALRLIMGGRSTWGG